MKVRGRWAAVLGCCALGTALLGGCNSAAKKQAQADARVEASGFVPPSVLSRLDYGGAIERRFHALDRNGDGVIAAGEIPPARSRWLTTLDRDGDGRIGSVEFSEGLLARFDRMDTNHDGTVTSEERETAHHR